MDNMYGIVSAIMSLSNINLQKLTFSMINTKYAAFTLSNDVQYARVWKLLEIARNFHDILVATILTSDVN